MHTTSGEVAGAMMLSLLLALLAAGVAGSVLVLWQGRRRRDIAALALRLRIRQALHAHPSLALCPISVQVRLPLRPRSTPIVTVSGSVPTPLVRSAALQLIRDVLARRYRRVETVARIVVDSPGPDVLLAEDDDASRIGLERLLKRWGCRVETAADGRAALEKILALHPSLVITDVAMPRLDGLQVLEVLRRDHPGTPVIVLTGQETPGPPVLSDTGARPYGYLRKPVEVHDLRLLVMEALTSRQAERRFT